MKTCSKCGESKPLNSFHNRRDTKSGKRSHCKVCVNSRNLHRYHSCTETRASHHKASRKHNLMKRYGIEESDYERMLVDQGGACKICGSTNPRTSGRKNNYFCIDHCHSTGKVRGLLCHGCNIGLGSFEDDVGRLVSAIHYLEGV
jgi:hypothetical protein